LLFTLTLTECRTDSRCSAPITGPLVCVSDGWCVTVGQDWDSGACRWRVT